MVRVDLHVHSDASFDSTLDLQLVVKRCRQLGLGPVFLTDHDTIADVEALQQQVARGAVILGEEVRTREGDLIGLFLERGIATGISAKEAVFRIKDQGGLVYLPHPLDPSRPSLRPEAIDSISEHIDIIETFNGRSVPKVNRKAHELCRDLGSTAGAGSDAHSVEELGAVYVEMEDFVGSRDFLRKLERARIVQRPGQLRLRLEATIRGVGR
jgi:predicted metal-dependent phosphoesterase TrpH